MKYERAQRGGRDENRREETNLGVGDVVEEEHGAGELVLDDLVPQPLHRSAVRDIRRVGSTTAASEQGDDVVVSADDGRPRVTAPREHRRVAVVGVDGSLDGVEGAGGAILAFVRLEPSETTDRGARDMATGSVAGREVQPS